MILYGYNISPYTAKVRAVLRHKRVPFHEEQVHPLRRQILKRLSGQLQVPVLQDDGRVVADSTDIVRYLEERFPERPVIPHDPVLRARALLLEEWSDEGLSRVVAPVRWLIPVNHERSMATFRGAYPAGVAEDAAFAAVGRFMTVDMRRKYTRSLTRSPSPERLRRRLAEVLTLLDDALAETGWLVGTAPTVADVAAWGWLHLLEGMEGWELVQARPRVVRMLRGVDEMQA
ncbi:MAG: glutathione S-transferase family protein [Myxococcota bacterium]